MRVSYVYSKTKPEDTSEIFPVWGIKQEKGFTLVETISKGVKRISNSNLEIVVNPKITLPKPALRKIIKWIEPDNVLGRGLSEFITHRIYRLFGFRRFEQQIKYRIKISSTGQLKEAIEDYYRPHGYTGPFAK